MHPGIPRLVLVAPMVAALAVTLTAGAPAHTAGTETPALRSISSRLDGALSTVLIEASEPVAYLTSQPDPLTVLVDLRNVTRGIAGQRVRSRTCSSRSARCASKRRTRRTAPRWRACASASSAQPNTGSAARATRSSSKSIGQRQQHARAPARRCRRLLRRPPRSRAEPPASRGDGAGRSAPARQRRASEGGRHAAPFRSHRQD